MSGFKWVYSNRKVVLRHKQNSRRKYSPLFLFFLSLFNRNCKIKETKKRLICIFIVGVTCKEKSESLKNGNDKVGRSTSHKNIILNVSASLLDFIYIFYIKLNFCFVRSVHRVSTIILLKLGYFMLL